jgi:MFS family permease
VDSRTGSSTVYAAGLVQGIVLVTFPAASTIFTSPTYFDLSNSQYGLMFLPQVALAISSSLLGATLSRRFSIKRVYLAGLLADLVSMALLFVSQFFTHDHGLAYGLLLAATASLGLGFGLTVPAINTLTATFHPDTVDGSVLVLNALLGLGTALAPLFVAIFVGLGAWWGLPLTSMILLVGLILVSSRLRLRTGAETQRVGHVATGRTRVRLPSRFWLFALFAVFYGICETMNGNWSQLYMTSKTGASQSLASLALTTFWAMVTLGRVFFALVQKQFPTRRTYHVLPFGLAAAFLLTALLPTGAVALGIAVFGLAGLGCSALLPLTISFAQEQLTGAAEFAPGGVIASYQAGFGLAAFGAGPLQSAGASLASIYGFTALIALAMGVLSFILVRPRHQTSHVHPRPRPLAAGT